MTRAFAEAGERAPFFSSSLRPFFLSRRRQKQKQCFSRRLIVILLIRGGIHPNPGPPSSPRSVVQWNCNGLFGAADALGRFLHDNEVKLACLQETKLKPTSRDPSLPGYSILRRDRPGGRGGGGLAFAIHHSISFTPIDTSFADSDPFIELQGINVTINDVALSVFNVYVPPASSCPYDYQRHLRPLSSGLPRCW